MKFRTHLIRHFIATLSVTGVITTSAHAAIAFTEESDFSDLLTDPSIIPGSLGIGVNTVIGSLPSPILPKSFHSRVIVFSDPDTDFIYINNPSFLSVNSITIKISNFIGTQTDLTGGLGRIELLEESISRKNTRADAANGQNISADGEYSLVPSVSNASQFKFRFVGPSDPLTREVGSMNYVLTLNVVPEPSSALLFTSLAITAVFRRRRTALCLGLPAEPS